MNDEMIVHVPAIKPEHIVGDLVEDTENGVTSFNVSKPNTDGGYEMQYSVRVHYGQGNDPDSNDVSKALRICDAFDAYINRREVLGVPDWIIGPPKMISPELQAASDKLIDGIAKEMREFGGNGPILQAIREKLGDAYIPLVVDLVMSKNPDLLEIAMRNSTIGKNLARLEQGEKGEENGTNSDQEV